MRFDLTVDLAATQAAAKAKIDADAETARQQWITPGSGQAMVYQKKADVAASFLAKYPDSTSAASATAADWPLINAEVGITAATLFDVASTWQQMAAAWQTAAAAIEKVRLGAKQAIDAAATVKAVNAAAAVTWPHP